MTARFFNTSGPVVPAKHYCIPPLEHLVVFDRDAGKTWEARIFRREESLGGRTVTVWGM